MNKEKLIQNLGSLYEEQKTDIFNQVSNIAYIAQGLSCKNNKEKVLWDLVQELKYQPYTGQYFLEKAAIWYKEHWLRKEEILNCLENVILAEKDTYTQAVDFLYYEAMVYFLDERAGKGIIKRIASLFFQGAAEEIETVMCRTFENCEFKENKRKEIDIRKLHYHWDDERKTKIEARIEHMPEEKLQGLLQQLWIRYTITFLLICNKNCKVRILANLSEEKQQEVEEFQGQSFYLVRGQIEESLHQLWEKSSNLC